MARTESLWEEVASSFIKSVWPEGRDILINGINHYLNFGTFSGVSGYGLRDNGGVIEFKDSGGSWVPVAGGTGTVTSVSTDSTLTGGPITTAGTLGLNLDNINIWTKKQYGISFTNTATKTLTRNAGGYVTSNAYTGGQTFTYSRDANNYITSKTDGTKTWTYTRNASNQITNVTVT